MQFLCNMWPIQLAFLLLIVCRTFLSSITLFNTYSCCYFSSFSRTTKAWYYINKMLELQDYEVADFRIDVRWRCGQGSNALYNYIPRMHKIIYFQYDLRWSSPVNIPTSHRPLVPWWALNPDTWTGFEILISCLTSFPFPPLQTATCSWDRFLNAHSGRIVWTIVYQQLSWSVLCSHY